MKRIILLIERPTSFCMDPEVITRVTIDVPRKTTPDVIMHEGAPFTRTNNSGYYCRANFVEAV